MIVLIRIAFTVSIVSLLACGLSFIHVEKLRHNYSLIASGNRGENCVVHNHLIVTKGGSEVTLPASSTLEKCIVYGVDQCPRGFYSHALGEVLCSGILLEHLISTYPIGSSQYRYIFKSEPTKYYSGSEMSAFIKKYGRNPSLDSAILATVLGASIFTCLFTGGYLALRLLEGQIDDLVAPVDVSTMSSDETEMTASSAVTDEEDRDTSSE